MYHRKEHHIQERETMIDTIITTISEHPVSSMAIATMLIILLASLAIMGVAIAEMRQLSGRGLPRCPQVD